VNLFIYVEGQEEEMFVNRVLRAHLLSFGVIVQKPILAATSFRIGGDNEPEVSVGGVTNYESIREDILNQFANDEHNVKFPLFYFEFSTVWVAAPTVSKSIRLHKLSSPVKRFARELVLSRHQSRGGISTCANLCGSSPKAKVPR